MTEIKNDEVRRLKERGVFYLTCGLKEDAVSTLERAAKLAPEDAEIAELLSRLRPPEERKGRVIGIRSRAERSPASAGQPEPEMLDEPEAPPAPAADEGAEIASAAATENAPSAPSNEHAALIAAFTAAHKARDWPRALIAGQALAEARPDDPKAWGSLALTQRRLFLFDAALESHNRAMQLTRSTNHSAARAKTLWDAGRYAEAEAAYEAVLPHLDPESREYADARMSLGMVRMTHKGPAAGVDDFEWRWKTGELELPAVDQPYWDGTPQPDKRILLFGEQGFGDAIQFARYVPVIAGRCAQVVMPCKPPLKRLMQSLPGAPDVRDQTISRSSFDLFIPAMSCMRILGAEPGDIPCDVPYLHAAAEDVGRLRPLIWDRPGLRVGIAWTGSPTNVIAWKKSIDPSLWQTLLAVPGVSFFSLQVLRDDMPERLKTVPDGVVDLAPHLNDFADTAAAIDCLDLVITVDTAVAHLAGALAKPVWNLIPKTPDWRWDLERTDCPWYPTMRLYRQDAFGDWAGVIAKVAHDLGGFRPPAGEEGKKRRGLTRLLPWKR